MRIFGNKIQSIPILKCKQHHNFEFQSEFSRILEKEEGSLVVKERCIVTEAIKLKICEASSYGKVFCFGGIFISG